MSEATQATRRKRIRIGDLLLQHGIISEQQLERALEEQRRTGRRLGRTLVDLEFISEVELLRFLAQQLQVDYVDLRNYRYDPSTIRLLSETYARRYRALVLQENDGECLVGMADPTDLFAYDELTRILGRRIRQAVVSEQELLEVLDRVYRRTEEINTLAEELGEELGEDDFDLARMGDEEADDAPVVRLLRTIFEDAVQIGASDIHIEPDDHVLRIRQRVDGVLQEQEMREHRIASALILRLKLMAGLNISEKRLPQDGRFNIKVKGHSIDVRLSTMPIQYGESVVMRLLDQSSGVLQLAKLGMPAAVSERFRKVIRQPHGIVLVTGPTGSGKSTTLYAALSELNEAGKKIITVEDPVEYRLPRINQVQVQERIGLTFSRVLRSALRQDPDIVLIGEMRDEETAEIGLRAAITGHLVLSTLHTNDAMSTPARLLDMGAEPYLLAASLRAVVAQRLLRRVCEGCARPQTLPQEQLDWLESVLGERVRKVAFRHGHGCTYCNGTGYRGRIGVYEMVEMTTELASALRRGDQDAFEAIARTQAGYRPLALAALDYADQAVTSAEEVMRVAGGLDITLEAAPVLSDGAAAADVDPQSLSLVDD